ISRANNFGNRPFAEKIYSFFSGNFIWELPDPSYEERKRIFKEEKEAILEAFRIADIDIIDYKLIFKNGESIPFGPQVRFSTFDGKEAGFGMGLKSNKESFELLIYHRSRPKVPFKWEEESTGTRKLLFGFVSLLAFMRNKKLFLIDEIDLHLHTKIVEFMIGLFNATDGSQLLFTSHNTNLMDLTKLRKDQIYFANKKSDGATELYSLYDFDDWKESFHANRSYLEGRFDAIPTVDESLTTLKSLIDG
ncbi:MAG: AAA family ATPase, partial [Bacteroidota bacterium]